MGREVGCLLMGETKRMAELQEMLRGLDVTALNAVRSGSLLASAQEGLLAVRRPGGVCIAAEGEMWAAALALSAQLHVDRVALIAPTDRLADPKDSWEKQIERLKGYARRNLFFCVSDVLVLEEEADPRSVRRMDTVCRRLCNARVSRHALGGFSWRNCKVSLLEAIVQFLLAGDCDFTLAK